KGRGIVCRSREIYGGLRASWDYGPLGVEIKNNIKRQWWKATITGRDDIVGLDSSVILAREVWEASGHVTEFVDPLTECQSCHKRFPPGHPSEAYAGRPPPPPAAGPGPNTPPNTGPRGGVRPPPRASSPRAPQPPRP